MSNQAVTLTHVEDSIVRVLQKTMGMDAQALRSGASFTSLDSHFDSLAVTELMISLEEEYDVEFDQRHMMGNRKMPDTLSELATAVHGALMASLSSQQEQSAA